MLKIIRVLNVNFAKLTKSELLTKLEKRIFQEKQTFLVTANPEIVMHAYNDHSYSQIVNSSDYTIADGIGVIIGSKILGQPLPERIAGFDLMTELLKRGNTNSWGAYFLGAKNEVLEQAIQNVKRDYPQLKIVGWNDGYFDWDSSHIQQEIEDKQPDLIFVALGFPKQEMWIANNLKSFNKGLFMGVGGSFDVLAGTVKRAPIVWQKLNLEWLYRLIKQPSRWRRMLVLPQFIIKVISNKNKSY
jgi:N-acetylglucosaminyldiphosphoundecaprenol N-acetyl-beta-D-mannosaminyltransferase